MSNGGKSGVDGHCQKGCKSKVTSIRHVVESVSSPLTLPFEPTTPMEVKMVCGRLHLIWITELNREAIDWSTLEAVAAEISRFERAFPPGDSE